MALLVDSDVRLEGIGTKAKRIVEAPSAVKLKTISDLVAGVIGLSSERGDRLVVETLPFESTLNPEQLAPPKNIQPAAPTGGREQSLANKLFLPCVGVGSAILLGLLFLVLRLTGKPAGGRVQLPDEFAPSASSDNCKDS